MLKKVMVAFILIFVVLVPTQVLAVDYKINDLQIDAYLQADGKVLVEETHTYSFNGEFGGIIRELVPKSGASIVELEAMEGNSPLIIEADEYEYRIHRSGADETITIVLTYEIHNGVEVYNDMVQFYWPFFDRRNESTYENLTITVFPPEATTKVVAVGYDEAYQKETILGDGQVVFDYGKVPSNRNGDIRVAYDTDLFTGVSVTHDGEIGPEILAVKQNMEERAAARIERQETLSSIGTIVLPVVALIFLFIVLRIWLEARNKQRALIREVGEGSLLPELKLSMPATICYTNGHHLTAESIAASLLDLVRKGHVNKVSDDQFQLVNRTGLLDHEQALVEWLFDEVGSGEDFGFDDLKAYTSNKFNHSKYQQMYLKWARSVHGEVKGAGLYEKKKVFRWTMAGFSLVLLALALSFFTYDLIGWFVGTLVFVLAFPLLAVTYYPKTWEGAKITYEWRKFKTGFGSLTERDWRRFSEEEKMRAFIYGLGVKIKDLKKQNETLAKAFQHGEVSGSTGNIGQPSTAYGFDPTWILVAGAASSNFQSGEKRTTVDTTSSGSSFSGGGGGAGGGGGGSGAF